MIEKRNDPKIEVNWPIRVLVDNRSIKGNIKDINLRGISIQCKDPINLEGNKTITIFPPNCKPINLVGKIARSDCYALDMKNSNLIVCIGLSFVELPNKDWYLLKKIIKITLGKVIMA